MTLFKSAVGAYSQCRQILAMSPGESFLCLLCPLAVFWRKSNRGMVTAEFFIPREPGAYTGVKFGKVNCLAKVVC